MGPAEADRTVSMGPAEADRTVSMGPAEADRTVPMGPAPTGPGAGRIVEEEERSVW
jgi:hypothetical protein